MALSTPPDVGRARPTYIHELDDWPSFRWDPERITDLLVRASRRQAQIIENVLAAGLPAAREATVRNLTASAVASSRIEGEYPDPASIRESIRRRIAAESAHAAELGHDEYGIAAVTTDAAENAGQPL